MLAALPIKLPPVHENPSQTHPVTTDPFRQRRNHNVRTVLQRSAQVGRRKGGIDNEGKAGVMRTLGNDFQIANLKGGIGARLAEEGPRLLIGRPGEIGRILGVDEPHLDAETGEDVVELRVRSPVQGVGGDDVVPRPREVDDGVEDGRCAGADGEAAEGVRALQLGVAALEDVRGGVHEAGVDVAELLEAEQLRGVLGVSEHERGGAVQRNAAWGALSDAWGWVWVWIMGGGWWMVDGGWWMR